MSFQHFSPHDRFFIGVDPGQQIDPTAIAAVRRVEDYSSLPKFFVGHLERLPLSTPYPGIVHRTSNYWRTRRLKAVPRLSWTALALERRFPTCLRSTECST
jgi:hypothetical protein